MDILAILNSAGPPAAPPFTTTGRLAEMNGGSEVDVLYADMTGEIRTVEFEYASLIELAVASGDYRQLERLSRSLRRWHAL